MALASAKKSHLKSLAISMDFSCATAVDAEKKLVLPTQRIYFQKMLLWNGNPVKATSRRSFCLKRGLRSRFASTAAQLSRRKMAADFSSRQVVWIAMSRTSRMPISLWAAAQIGIRNWTVYRNLIHCRPSCSALSVSS